MKKITKILIVAAVLSLSVLLYPAFSNYWNSKHATRQINSTLRQTEALDPETKARMLSEAGEYNRLLFLRPNGFSLTDEQEKTYASLLDLTGTGVMGFLEIPKLGVALPIYHGTDNTVLQIAAGHLDWSSLPVGGADTHCVISGHRGLPSAKLFTDLDKLREGDTFTVTVVGTVLTYQVDQIRTVLPDDTSYLKIEEGEDLFTLVTCTPYGINTHRLLVRGHRVEGREAKKSVVSEAVLVDQLIVALVLALPLLFLLFMAVMLKKPERKPKITVEYPSEE